jgi:hypothetical protein
MTFSTREPETAQRSVSRGVPAGDSTGTGHAATRFGTVAVRVRNTSSSDEQLNTTLVTGRPTASRARIRSVVKAVPGEDLRGDRPAPGVDGRPG